jgi:hypothetical protein
MLMLMDILMELLLFVQELVLQQECLQEFVPRWVLQECRARQGLEAHLPQA